MLVETDLSGYPAADFRSKSIYSADAPALTIIVPTKNEAGNVDMLLSRIQSAMEGISTEVVFVDDSTDHTPQVITRAVNQYGQLIVRLVHRNAEQRVGGLGGAVVAGMRAAQAEIACVMDGDLQHPPEIIPLMLEKIQEGQADLMVASRRVAESENQGLSPIRTFISKSLDLFGRILFPRQLRGVSDPLTGFFMLRVNAIDLDALHPQGFKILMEILVQNPQLRKGELPFRFGERLTGKSKASSKEAYKYLYLLLRLRFGEKAIHFMGFAIVGISGIFVNTLALAFFTSVVGIHYLVSAIFATIFSTTWNFALTEYIVFGSRKNSAGRVKRYILFFAMNNLALLFRGPIMYALTTWLGIHYLISNLISLGLLVVLRFSLADSWIWGKSRSGKDAAQSLF